MPNNEMDYSLIHRTPDGTGKILVTTPGSPDKGSWETEAELKTYVNQDVNAAINAVNTRVTNIEETLMGENEITVQYPDDGNYSSLMPNRVPARALKFAEVPRFRGKTRAWNSLGKAQTSGSAITRINDYSVSVSFDSSFSGYTQINEAVQTVNGHKYLVYYKQTSGTNLRTAADGIFKYYDASTIEAGNAYIADGDGTTDILQVAPYTEGVGGSGTFYSIVRDITLYFGGTLPADGDTVEKLQANYPELFVLSAYNAGSLVSTTVEGVESVSRNLFDNVWEEGYLNSGNGTIVYSGAYATTDFIPVLPSTLFYIKGTQSAYDSVNIAYYDNNKNFLRFDGSVFGGLDTSFTTDAGAYYLRITITLSSTSKEGLCINKSDSLNGTFTPFFHNTLSLPSVTLKGVGTCVETYDPETGVLDDGKFALIDLGTLNWSVKDSTRWFSWSLSDIAKPAVRNDVLANIMCAVLMPETWNNSYDGKIVDRTICIGNEAQIGIYNTEWNGKTGAEIKTALSGVYFLYEKATYTPSTAITPVDPFIEVEGGGTMETIQEQTPVIDNCLDVTYDIIPQ